MRTGLPCRAALYGAACVLLCLLAVTVDAGATLSPRTGKWCKLVRKTAKIEDPLPEKCAVAILSGGSFIQLAKGMQSAPGVYGVIKGYTGGFTSAGNVSYADVCAGKTGMAEAVMVAYDTTATNYTEILQVFFDKHDATAAGAMMAVVGDETYYGSQFRSAVFVRRTTERTALVKLITAMKRKNAVAAGDNETKRFKDTIVTRGLRFDGVFLPETASDEQLKSIRAKVQPDPTLRERYIRKMQKHALVANVVEKQGAGNDDALAKEFERLDREGRLAGAAVRSSEKAWKLVRDGKVSPKHPNSVEAMLNASKGADNATAANASGIATAGTGVPAVAKQRNESASAAGSDNGQSEGSVPPPPPTTAMRATTKVATTKAATTTAAETDGSSDESAATTTIMRAATKAATTKAADTDGSSDESATTTSVPKTTAAASTKAAEGDSGNDESVVTKVTAPPKTSAAAEASSES